MFRQLPNYLSTTSGTGATTFTAALAPPTNLFDRYPLDVVAYMEAYWNKRNPSRLHRADPALSPWSPGSPE